MGLPLEKQTKKYLQETLWEFPLLLWSITPAGDTYGASKVCKGIIPDTELAYQDISICQQDSIVATPPRTV